MISRIPPLPGVTLSRTLIPVLPPHFLSRHSRFAQLDKPAPASTLVIAPAGYGKSTLIAEWASQQSKPVAWLTLTENDSLQEMSALFVQATRNIIPGFGRWFEDNQPMRPSEVVRRWGNDLLATGKEYIFVLDNVREDDSADIDVANKLIEQFPNNVRFIAIRRTPLQSLFEACSTRGETNIIDVNDLKFTEEEIATLAEAVGVDFSSNEIKKAVTTARGWPSATSLILHQLAAGEELTAESLMQASQSALGSLAQSAVARLEDSDHEMLMRLAIVPEFSHDLAREILADRYSYSRINAIAADGQIISSTSNPDQSFQFSSLMRSIFLNELSDQQEVKDSLNAILVNYYQRIGRGDLAMDAAFALRDQATVSKLFRPASRIKQAQGKGDDLIRWAQYAGASPVDGVYKKDSMIIAGMLCNLDFKGARAMLEKLNRTLANAEDPEFLAQFSAASQAFIDLNVADFKSFMNSYERVMKAPSGTVIAPEEQIMVLRLAAAKSFILDETDELMEIAATAAVVGAKSDTDISHAYVSAINSLALFSQGEYRQAYEAATMTLRQFGRIGIVGLLGPVDLYFVIARCLLEFARRDEAYEYFGRALELSREWGAWHWYIAADGYFARDLALHGQHHEALDRLQQSRDLIEKMNNPGSLQALVDMDEMFVRHQMRDINRMAVLVSRGLDTFYVRQIARIIDQERGRKTTDPKVKVLPDRNPREKIWKHIVGAIDNFSSEQTATAEIKNALKIGAAVGARETFLRQGPELAKLIIKVAHENPTVYNEDLARAMAERMKEREMADNENTQSLTKREREILTHLATGRTLTTISADLHISQNTMKTHLKNLYKKLGADGRDTAVEKAKALFLI